MHAMSDTNTYTRVVDTLVGHGKVYHQDQLLCEVTYKILVEQEMSLPLSEPSQEAEAHYRLTGDVMQSRLPKGQELELELEGGRRIKIRAISETEFVGNEADYQP